MNKEDKKIKEFMETAITMKDEQRKKSKNKYKKTWGTKLGKDCINLDNSLAKWLGKRLVFLSEHTNSFPDGKFSSYEKWCEELKHHGEILLAYEHELYDEEWSPQQEVELMQRTKASLRWAVDNFEHLWD